MPASYAQPRVNCRCSSIQRREALFVREKKSFRNRATALMSSDKQCRAAKRTLTPRHCFSEDSSEVLRQTKVAIIVPHDEHCSKTYQTPIRMVSNQKFKRNICPDASATVESFPTHAHHA